MDIFAVNIRPSLEYIGLVISPIPLTLPLASNTAYCVIPRIRVKMSMISVVIFYKI